MGFLFSGPQRLVQKCFQGRSNVSLGLQGTARPAHYYVVVDEIFRSKHNNNSNSTKELMKLTHAISYLYPRATKAVSIVSPAYLADLVCDRGRRYLSRYYDSRFRNSNRLGKPPQESVQVNSKLKDTMYYI